MVVFEHLRKSRYLLKPQYLVYIHPEMLRDPFVRSSDVMQLADDIAHQIDIVRPSGPVVPDRRCHSFCKRFIDDGYRQASAFALEDIRTLQDSTRSGRRPICSYSADYILEASDRMNATPRKSLDYHTPEELFDQFLDQVYSTAA